MKNDIWAMLNESEQALLREIEPRKLRKLDEDELVAVHQRVRRARNKYSKNYRRGAAAQVAKDGGRGVQGREADRAGAARPPRPRARHHLGLAGIDDGACGDEHDGFGRCRCASASRRRTGTAARSPLTP